MPLWKVIALISGNIEAVSGPAAQDRPGTHEWIVWESSEWAPLIDAKHFLIKLRYQWIIRHLGPLLGTS